MSVWRFAEDFVSVPEEARLTLGEGDTPVVRSKHLGPEYGLNNLFLKLESCNPTGSYKDRFAFNAISHMVAAGQTRCIATTSGNTGAALAAYCAVAQIECHIAVVETAPVGKLQQMMAYGANILRVRNFGTDADVTNEVYETLRRLGERDDSAMQISAFTYSPLGMSGVRTIAFELAEQFDCPIDHVFTPAGGGGMTWGVADAFLNWREGGRIDYLPRVECVQPEGNNTIAGPLRDGLERGQDVECTTKISGLQVASCYDGHQTIPACRSTGGTGHLVTDDFIWEVQKRLAREEGVFCEPAGAAATAGALQAAKEGMVENDAIVVSLVSGSGFKDPSSVDVINGDRDCALVEPNEVEARMMG